MKTSIAALKGRQRNPDARFDMAAHWFRGLEKARKDGHEELNERHVLSAAVANLGAGSGEFSPRYLIHKQADIDVVRLLSNP